MDQCVDVNEPLPEVRALLADATQGYAYEKFRHPGKDCLAAYRLDAAESCAQSRRFDAIERAY
ncbi:MAG: hypothetical protein DLM70_04020 [Chloroflexi bacterium]|nr:MAG: hypothetical protein DLM70_04020 [Chloroflexota bacterium]